MHLADAAALARHLMDRHGLQDWSFAFDNAKTRAGVCRPASRRIGLSRPLTSLHADSEVQDTILHEIAHALVGPDHGHDEVWRAKARELGCSAERCMTSVNGTLAADWVGTCPVGHVTTRYRRPKRALSCGRCSSRFEPQALIEWTYRGRTVEMPPAYQAEVAALRARSQSVAAAVDAAADPLPVLAASRPSLPVGTVVRLVGSGSWAGLIGRVVKLGRTRYHVQTAKGLITVPLDMVVSLLSS